MAVALAAVAALAAPARAQTEAPAAPPATREHSPPLIRYGKWVALALATGFMAEGTLTHERADDHFQDLLAYCRTGASCAIGIDGRYANPAAESIFQRSVHDDRIARRWLLGGQAALLGSAVLFVLELSRKGGPPNIPFSPYIVAGGTRTRFGLRVGW
jgi:hypothetical protein